MKKALLPLGLLLAMGLVGCNSGGNNPNPESNQSGTGTGKFVGGDTISEFNKTSKFFPANSTEGLDLPTYHAKDKGDVPYVNLNDFFATAGNQYSAASKVEGKLITFSNPERPGAYIKFNAAENNMEFKNINSITTFAKSNNGLGPDLALDATIYLKESNKTKVAKEGVSKTFNLNPYGLNIYEQGGQFYAPFEMLCNTVLSAQNFSYNYNGKDFFQDTDAFTSVEYTSLCYSGENGFLYSTKYSNGQREYNAGFYKADKKANEEYRFQTKVGEKGEYSAVVLYNDNTGKLLQYNTTTQKEEEAKVEFNFGEGKRLFTYKKEGNLLKLNAYDVDLSETKVTENSTLKHSLFINLDKTRFGLTERSQEVADYNYGLLCVTFDYFYGVKEAKGIQSFDTFFTQKNLKEGLKSKTIKTYSETLTKALQSELNDAHTAISSLSVYEEPASYLLNTYAEKYKAKRNDEIFLGTGALQGKRFDAQGADPLHIVGDTAFISFDKFTSFGLLSGMSSYTEEPSEYANGNAYNGLGIVCSALNTIANNKDVKNVVLDITANTGGLLNTVPFIAGITTADPTMYLKDTVSGQVIEFHYTTLLNGDPEPKTLADKYNFFVMTSKYSFSCATALPTMLKGSNVKIIGQAGAGGTCPVFRCNDACGSTFVMSGIYNIVYKNGNDFLDNENGIPVDIEIAEADFYDFEKVATLIKR